LAEKQHYNAAPAGVKVRFRAGPSGIR